MARMPRVHPAAIKAQLAEVESLIARHTRQGVSGVSRATLETEYAKQYGYPIPRRTLIRRLDQLIESGRVRVEGRGKNATYYASASARSGVLPAVAPSEPEPADVPLSPAGMHVRSLVRRPKMERAPVGYDSTFLESYAPGQSWYLPLALRNHLHQIGHTPDADRPAGTYAREIYEQLLIDLSWASSRLEGNTYSRIDTQNLLEFGQRAEGKDAAEAQMILNHKAAIALLVEQAEYVGFNRYTFLSLHAALAANLLSNPNDEGRLRTRLVNISGSTYTPTGIPQKIEEHFDLLLTTAAAIPDPFEQAFFVMVHLPYLQPFMDVNKRTSRLGANLPFIKANLSPLSFVEVPERAYVDGTLGVYELTRVELLRDVFVWAYERSCAQYRIVREALGTPDLVRLRYQAPLAHVVREMVLSGAPPRRETLHAWASSHNIPAVDVEAFAERALALLLALHEGSLILYGLQPAEFTAWKSQFTPR